MSVYTNETTTYADLVALVNEIGSEYRALTDGKALSLRIPAGIGAGWTIEFRADPHTRLTDVVFEMQVKPRGEILGLMVARDEGDAQAKLALDGYYAAVARLIVSVTAAGITPDTGAAGWRAALEADTPEAAELDEIIGTLRLFWFFRRMLAEKKSLAQSSSDAIGATSG